MEIIQSEKQIKINWGKRKQSLRNLSDNNKWFNTGVIGVWEGKDKEEGAEKLWRNSGWIFPKFGPPQIPQRNLQFKESEWTPNRTIPKKSMPRHILVKLLKSKDKGKIVLPEKETDTLPIRQKQS